jgi:hypothetical protein
MANEQARPSGRYARWQTILMNFDYEIMTRLGPTILTLMRFLDYRG